MGNEAYLCCSDFPDIYPSHDDANFDPQINTIAAGAGCIPLIWLTLFSKDSLTTKVFHSYGEEFTATAPIASRLLCIERMAYGIRRLEALLELPEMSLMEFGRCLEEALCKHAGEFVTIELQEIVALSTSEDDFYDSLKCVLDWLVGSNPEGAKQAALSLGDLDLRRPLPPPRNIYNFQGLENQDFRNHENLLGSGHCGSAPWEV